MTVSAIRDKMQFEAEYFGKGTDGKEITIRVYVTKKPGLYGYQFAACAWMGDKAVGTNRTGGYGYNKEAKAFSDALSLLGFAHDSEPYKAAQGGCFNIAMRKALGEDGEYHTAHR